MTASNSEGLGYCPRKVEEEHSEVVDAVSVKMLNRYAKRKRVSTVTSICRLE